MPHRKKNQVPRSRGKLSTNKTTIQQLVGELLQNSSKWSFSSKKEEWKNYLHLHDLIQQIIKHQAEGQLCHHRGSDKDGTKLAERFEHARALHTWVMENGGRVVGVECCQTEHGLGMQCCQTLQCGQTVLEIPRRIMLTLDSARHTLLGELLHKDCVAAAVPQVRLALHLLEQWLNLERNGWWRPYLLSLPLEYDTVLYFTPEELTNLSGSRCLDEAVKQFRNIGRQYAYFHQWFGKRNEAELLQIQNYFTYDLFRWCVSTVMTRQNSVPSLSDSSQHVPALIPLWDLCNHGNGQLSTEYDVELGKTICYSSIDYRPGEEFRIFYGVRTNAQFFLHNGFVFAGNEHDSVEIKLGISGRDQLRCSRAQLLGRLELPATAAVTFQLPGSPYSTQLPAKLLAFCRVFVMDRACLDEWLCRDDVTPLLEDPCAALVPACERAAWTFINTRLQLLLESYPTTSAADPEPLASQSRRGRLALALCRLERRTLQNFINITASRCSV